MTSLPSALFSQDWYRLGTNNFDLQIVDENTIVIIGQAGRIVRSDDEGTTWQQLRSGVGLNLHGVHFFDPQVGVVVGESGVVLRTDNGGATWNRIETGGAATLRRLTSAGENNLIAVGDSGAVMRSTNKGVSWEAPATGTTNGLRSVDMWNATAGVAVGDAGTIIRTTDGGSSWQPMVSTTPVRLNDVLYLSADSVLAVGDRFETLLSVDAGTTWRSVVDSLRGSPTAAYAQSSFRRVTRIPGGDLLAVGQSSNSYNVWRSSDLGRTWITSHDGTVEYLLRPYLAVSFVDANTGYIAGTSSSIYRTEDGGHSWQPISRLPLQSEPQPDAIHLFVNSQKMFSSRNIAAALESTSGGYFQSADSGVTWTQVPVDNRVDFHDMHFFDSLNGRAITLKRQMFTTTDGGNNWWITAQQGIPNTVRNGWAGMAYHGMGLGLVHSFDPAGAYLYYTTDSSQTWSRATDPPIISFNDVAYADDGRVIGIGGTGAQFEPKFTNRILTSADSGATWQILLETRQPLRGIAIIDSRKWVVTLDPGGFLRTTDAGLTWDTISIPDKYFIGARFFNANDGYAYGGSGIWRTGDGGETWQEESLAEAGFPNGLTPTLMMYGIELSPDRRTLLAGGNGLMFRKELAEPIPLPAASAPDRAKSPGSLRLSVMPNPVRDAAVLRIVGMRDQGGLQGTLYLYDALGRTVVDLSGELRRSSDGTTIEIELPVDHLRSGSYSVRGVVGGESVQGMFVVAK